MKIEILIFITLLCANNILTSTLENFESWREEYKVKYTSKDEEKQRYDIWKSNLDYITNHNLLYQQGKSSFSVKMNEFGDLTSSEYYHKVIKPNNNHQHQNLNGLPSFNEGVPDSWDWRDKNVVPHVTIETGPCSAAYHAEGSAIESIYAISKGKLTDLDTDEIKNCFGIGCQGLPIHELYKYVMVCGVPTQNYPPSKCNYDAKKSMAIINGFKVSMKGNETDLKLSIFSNGPYSVAVDAAHSSFQFYSGGVYYERSCSSTQLDHEMLAVGYGGEKDGKYWIVQNSWGTSWGMRGYILMARDRNNNCGIATLASCPTLGTNTFKPNSRCSHWI